MAVRRIAVAVQRDLASPHQARQCCGILLASDVEPRQPGEPYFAAVIEPDSDWVDDCLDPPRALRRELAAGGERISCACDQQSQQPQRSASQHRRPALDQPMQTDLLSRVQRD
jgi:hypothetical protein